MTTGDPIGEAAALAFGRVVTRPGDPTILAELEAAGLTAEQAKQVHRQVRQRGESYETAALLNRAVSTEAWSRVDEDALRRLDEATGPARSQRSRPDPGSSTDRLAALRERAVQLRLSNAGGERRWAEVYVRGMEAQINDRAVREGWSVDQVVEHFTASVEHYEASLRAENPAIATLQKLDSLLVELSNSPALASSSNATSQKAESTGGAVPTWADIDAILDRKGA